MAKKPEPPKPITWNILYAGAKARPLGEVEAMDEREAVAKGAEQFGRPATKLIAVRYR